MRRLALLIGSIGCFPQAYRPPLPASAPRFSLQAQETRDATLCARMANWDCLDLDCPDCAAVAAKARGRDVIELIGAMGAVAGLGTGTGTSPTLTPFANALSSGADPLGSPGLGWPALREASAVQACQGTCRRCAQARLRCSR